MTKKHKNTPVKENTKAENTCQCGCETEGCHCHDKADGTIKPAVWLKCGTMLASAIIISATILGVTPCDRGPMRGPADKAAFQKPEKAPKAWRGNEEEMRKFIMQNPKVLIDSVEAYYQAQQAKQAPAQPQELKTAPADLVDKIVNDKTNYSLGNPKGKFVIIEFFDYQCGWCKRTNKALAEVIAKPEGKNIRWIPIDTPIFGDASETIARYVLAAGEQGKYAEMHDAVGAATERLDEKALIEMGKKLGLDTKKLTADANGDKIKGKLKANQEFARTLNISGVPMLIVDGKINPGALLGERLDKAVKASQAKK